MAKLEVKQFITEFVDLAKTTIVELENGDYPDGKAKKAKLDQILLAWAIPVVSSLAVPIWAKFGIKFILNKYLPVITQKIFDLIELKIAGITDKKADV